MAASFQLAAAHKLEACGYGLSLLPPNGWLTGDSVGGCGATGRNCVMDWEASKSAMFRDVRLIGGNCRSRYLACWAGSQPNQQGRLVIRTDCCDPIIGVGSSLITSHIEVHHVA